ncbi:MAG: hypothetical protein K2R98_23480 [Gemmataceae bacterium]|nr:hypothetical protein [Gemmataceae bacterium]
MSRNEDVDQLKLLSIFYYVVGGLIGLFSCFPLLYVFIGIMIIGESSRMSSGRGDPPPALFGGFFVVLGLAFFTLGWTLAICALFTGRFLSQHRRYIFCLVVACLLCLQMPFGTILGVFTIIVLQRQSVKELFQESQDGYVDRSPRRGGVE